jgi:putative tricarboxylic transport membrane protein
MRAEPRFGLEAAFDVLLLAVGGVIAYVSWDYGFGSLSRPGPGLYPFFVGIAIAAFAFLTLVASVRSGKSYKVLGREGARTLAVMSATFCLWILTMPVLGYVLVTLVATFVFAKAVRLEGWVKPLAVAGGTALFIYLLFDVWLYIDLPRGIFAG